MKLSVHRISSKNKIAHAATEYDEHSEAEPRTEYGIQSVEEVEVVQ